jgi:hypothetical protein
MDSASVDVLRGMCFPRGAATVYPLLQKGRCRAGASPSPLEGGKGIEGMRGWSGQQAKRFGGP